MKNHIYIYLAFCLLVLVSSCKQLGDQKVAYLAHTLPTSHPVHQGMEVFAKEVLQKTEIRIRARNRTGHLCSASSQLPEYYAGPICAKTGCTRELNEFEPVALTIQTQHRLQAGNGANRSDFSNCLENKGSFSIPAESSTSYNKC